MDIREEYSKQMHIYSQAYFEYCKRSEKIVIKLKEKQLATTWGQLNFFKWLIESGSLDFIEKNYAAILNEAKNKIKVKQAKNKIIFTI
jgi:hypothetical protein